MAVDFARVTFTRPFRFFRDSDTEVTVKWYRAAPDAKVLPHASIYSLDLFREDNYQQRPVGEVIADKPVWIDPRDRPPNALGQHLCDTPLDWWTQGQPVQPGREPLARDGWGIPLCCTGFILGGPGGLLLDGTGSVASHVPSDGGLSLDGAGGLVAVASSVGGLSLDGSGDAVAVAFSDGGLSLDGSGDASPVGGGTLLYADGTFTGETTAWTVGFGWIVSNDFVLGSTVSVTKIKVRLWVGPSTTVSNVTWSIGSSVYGSDVAGGTAVATQEDSYVNSFGYSVLLLSWPVGPLTLAAGTYWLTLQDTVADDATAVFWDESDGPSNAHQFDPTIPGDTVLPGGEYFEIWGP